MKAYSFIYFKNCYNFQSSGPEAEAEAVVPDRRHPTLDPQQQQERQPIENHLQTE